MKIEGVYWNSRGGRCEVGIEATARRLALLGESGTFVCHLEETG